MGLFYFKDFPLKKKILIGVLVFGLGLLLVLGFGLYLMEIEDHYGDLQELYYESHSGYIIVNKEDKEVGILSKNWRRLNIITEDQQQMDLYNWVYSKNEEASVAIYKLADQNLKIDKLSFGQVKKMIDNSELTFVTSN